MYQKELPSFFFLRGRKKFFSLWSLLSSVPLSSLSVLPVGDGVQRRDFAWLSGVAGRGF